MRLLVAADVVLARLVEVALLLVVGHHFLLERPTRARKWRSAARRCFRVDLLDEVEPLWRRVEAERGAVARFQCGADVLWLPLRADDHGLAAARRAPLGGR